MYTINGNLQKQKTTISQRRKNIEGHQERVD